jgi:hypothetical protein
MYWWHDMETWCFFISKNAPTGAWTWHLDSFITFFLRNFKQSLFSNVFAFNTLNFKSLFFVRSSVTGLGNRFYIQEMNYTHCNWQGSKDFLLRFSNKRNRQKSLAFWHSFLLTAYRRLMSPKWMIPIVIEKALRIFCAIFQIWGIARNL